MDGSFFFDIEKVTPIVIGRRIAFISKATIPITIPACKKIRYYISKF